jgi:hypothetical protein
VPEALLEALLRKWTVKAYKPPEYRAPKCWGCGKEMYGEMWHVFFRGVEREAHLCKECGKPWEFPKVYVRQVREAIVNLRSPDAP